MEVLRRPLHNPRYAAICVGVVALLVYANAPANGFAFDDVHIIVDNTAIHDLQTLPGAVVRPYWPHEYGRELGLWRPVTTAALGLQHVVTGGSAWFFHLVNVAGHGLASILVLLLLVELMSIPAALAAGLVFAVHPLHVEAVANVIGLSEILSTIGLLAACLVHVRGGETTRWRNALGVGAFYLLAFGAKESAVTLPGLVFLVDAARGRLGVSDLGEYLRRRWRTYAVLAFVAAVMLGSRLAILGSMANAIAPLGGQLLEEIPRIWTIAEVWTHYVRLWVFPLDLASDYSPNVIPVSIGWHAANTVGLVMAFAVLLVALISWQRPTLGVGSRSARTVGFGVVWFVIAISPISNVFFLSGVLLAERTLYLPSVGLAAATGWFVVRLARDRPRGAWVLLLLALVLSSARTWARTPSWKDNQSVFGTMVNDYPHSGRAQWILGDRFLDIGSISQGLTSYRAAIGILGGQAPLLIEISKKLMQIEHYRAAQSLLEFAWEQDPDFALAPSLLTSLRAEHGDALGTEHFARVSLGLFDQDPARHHLLAWSLASQGRWEEAAAARARGEERARATFWQAWLYDAYVLQRAGDLDGAAVARDSARARVGTTTGAVAFDSIMTADFSRIEERGGEGPEG